MRKLSNRDTKASSHKDIIHGRLIVRFKPSAVEAVAAGPRLTGAGPKAIAAARAALPDEISGPLDYLRDVAGVKSMTPMFVSSGRGGNSQRTSASLRNFSATHEAVVASAVSTRSEQRRGFQMLELKSDKDAAKIIKKLQASKAVDFVEEVPNRWLCAGADPLMNRQWGLRATGWFKPPKHPSAASVHVAVLDSGIDAAHPDLKDVLESYANDGKSARDVLGHGTHVTGIIAAAVNNGIGIAGIANCRIHMTKIFADPPANAPDPADAAEFDFDTYIHALEAAIDNTVKVVNMSIGGGRSTNTELLIFQQLADAGVVCVAAMGNEFLEGNPTEFPAAYPGVVAVGAIDEVDRRADFSNTGKHISLVAPGVNILSTVPRQRAVLASATSYDSWPGTSMATPHVAGAAALLYAKKTKSGASAEDVIDRLKATARKLSDMNGKASTKEFGHGVLDIASALKGL